MLEPQIRYDDVQVLGTTGHLFRFLTEGGYGDGSTVEILFEGPAGAGGKTRTDLEAILQLCEQWSGLRVLMLRLVRAHLAQTALQEFEESVRSRWSGRF